MRALFALLANLLRLPFWPLWRLSRALGRPRGRWVMVRLRPRVVELDRPRPFFVRYVPGLMRLLPTPLSVLRRLVASVAKDPRTDGVLFVVPPLMAGWATCKGLRDVMGELQAAGKEAVVYLPRGGGNRELYVASGASRFYLGPEATLAALGLAVENRYFKPLLDRAGLRVEGFARGEYKTAAEPLVRDTMSEAQREQMEALLGAMDRELVGAVAARLGGSEARARALFDRVFLRGRAAVEEGLADGVCYEDELPARLAAGDPPAKLVRAPLYLAFHRRRFFGRVLPRPYIAVVEVHGVITDEVEGPGQRAASLDDVVRALRAARADRRALGVLLHIDSPGGSATASDLMHREVVRLAERKPVVACFGNVAASGGYYVAAPAHRIVAQPVALTGSIGVLSARLVARDLLERVGIRTHTLRTAPHADMFSANRELTDDERTILERELDAFYEAFLQVVAQGRRRSVQEVDEVARGRVWAGTDAHRTGLVDRLGGFEAALEEVRARLPLPEPARAAVEPRRVAPPRGEPPLPEPPPRTPTAALWGRLAPEVSSLVALAAGRERVLYYAAALPHVE